MNDEDFFLAELGMIDVDEGSLDECQKKILDILKNPFNPKARARIIDTAFSHRGKLPEGDVGVPYSFEHIKLVLLIRQKRLHALEQRRSSEDPLQKVLNPAFELVKTLGDKNEAFYVDDLDRRWNIAGNACDWEGVLRGKDGRKIALVHSPVWQMLGSNELFDDGLGFDTPPFYLNGGWLFGWRTITKKELDKAIK